MAEQASQGRHHQPDSAPPPLPASGGRVVKTSKGGRKRGSAASNSGGTDSVLEDTASKKKRVSHHHTSQQEIPIRKSTSKPSGRKTKLAEDNIDSVQEDNTSLSISSSKSKSKKVKHSNNSESGSKTESASTNTTTSSRKLSPSSSKSTSESSSKYSSKSLVKFIPKLGDSKDRIFSLRKVPSHYLLRSQNKRSRGGGKRSKSKDLSSFTANLGSVESSSSSSGESCERETRAHSSRHSASAITGTCTSTRRWGGSGQSGSSNKDCSNSNMADDQPPPDINPTSGAGGSSGGGLDSESDDSEVGRLQALLEARGLPPHLFGALAPRMHHLLHRTIGTNTSTKAQQLLQGLQASSDEGQQMQALTEMCQMLVMGNEDTLAGFPVKQVVPALINLLGMEHNFDMMNHACRALTYMMEALPRSSSVVLDAVPVFLEKLQSITCMDVAEQSLTALELLSRRHSKAILQARGVVACLTYLDFFGINAQRSALAVTANCCINIQPEELHLVSQSLPVLATRLTQQDQKSVESVCLALSRLVDGLQSDTSKLMEVATTEILTNLQQLLVVSPPIINSSTFITVVRMLTVMCSSSPELALTLLKSNIAETLCYLLTGRADASHGEVELVARAPQEVYEMTCLICELMPRLPRSQALFSVDSLLERPHFVHSATVDAPTVSWQWRDDNGHWRPYPPIDSTMIEAAHQTGEVEVSLSTLGRMYTVDFNSMEQINEDTGTSRPVERRILRPQQLVHQTNNNSNENEIDASLREVASSFIRSLFSVLYEVYSSSAGPAVRCKCLKALLRMVYFASPELLKEVLKAQMVASQLAGMMASQDLRIVVSALQMAEILMQKLPDLFSIHFTREGVLYQIKQLADPGVPLGPSPTKLTPTASSPLTPGTNDSPLPGPSNISSAHPFNGTICRIVPVSSNQANDMVDVINMDDEESPLSDCSPITRRMRELRKPKRVLKRDKHRQESNTGNTDFSPSMHDLLSKHKHSSQSIGSRTVRSRLSVATMKTGGFLASLNPARWGRTTDRYKTGFRKETGMSKCMSSSSLWAVNREKVRTWVRERAHKFVSSFSALELNNASDPSAVLTSLTQAISSLNSFEEDKLGPLVELCNTVMDCDISPFEVNHSGLVKSLLDFLTQKSDKRDHRIRTFLHVFTNCPMDSTVISDCTLDSTCLQALVSKLNSCVSQLEQFPVKVHDLPAPSGSTTALKFFNTHQLKCQLSRHPDCSNLKQWKGGTVKIDPLALVQAIERYLVVRGYAKIRDKHSSQSDDENSEEDIDDTLVGMTVGSTRHKLQFLINDQVLPYNMTVYQAIRQFSPAAATASDQSETDTDSEMPLGSANIWVQTHTVHYRPVADIENPPKINPTFTTPRKGKGSSSKTTGKKKMDELWNDGSVPKLVCAMDRYLWSDLCEKVTVTDASLPVLCLLNALYTISNYWTTLYPATQGSPILLQQEFINSKIAAKAGRQLQDPLVIMTGNLPSWLQQIATACPFLLPFETRQLLLYATAFDRDRALQRLLDSSPELGSSGDSQERVTPRLDRRKRTVAREDILKQAETLISDMAQSKALLEVQYENEVGTGLGPTLEFYALVSRELQRKDLDLWHALDTPVDASHVHSPVGLYPQPIPRTARVAQLIKLRNKFRFIGKFMAKAVMDSRMLDLPLSRTFYRWILGEESSLGLSDLAHVNPSVHATLVKLWQIVNAYNTIQNSNEPIHIKNSLIQDLTLDGCPIENLGLDFTLPGYPNIEMRKGGKDINVTIHNLEDYCKLVVHWYLVEGVGRQMECVREGVQAVFPISHLGLFYPDELDSIFCGSSTYWDMSAFIESCRTDHGYTPDSRAIKFLFEVLSSYDTQQQRDFVQFVTGSPRLPVGGFKSLSPPITIVRKTVDGNLKADDFLPSVMTCVNYLKLPDYSSVELMRDKLNVAAREGQRSFHLS